MSNVDYLARLLDGATFEHASALWRRCVRSALVGNNMDIYRGSRVNLFNKNRERFYIQFLLPSVWSIWNPVDLFSSDPGSIKKEKIAMQFQVQFT